MNLKDVPKDPCFLEWSNIFHRDPPRIQTPIEALGEKKGYAYLAGHPATPLFFSTPDHEAQPPMEVRLALSRMIMNSEVIYITEEMLALLRELCEKIRLSLEKAPEAYRPRKLPYPSIWFTSPKGMLVPRIPYESKFKDIKNRTTTEFSKISNTFSEDAQLIMDEGFACFSGSSIKMNSFGFGAVENKGIICSLSTTYPEFLEGICILLEEKIARMSEVRMPRSFRRTIKGLHGNENELIRVLHLRAFENEDPSWHGEGTPFEYAHRFIVRGHIRNQYFPSTKDHRLIWIDPFMKGPKDAPLVETIKVLKR